MGNHIVYAPGLREWFAAAPTEGNPDALLLALKIRQKTATDSVVFDDLLPRPFSPSRFFTVDHLTSIANCLKVNLIALFPLSVSLFLGRFES